MFQRRIMRSIRTRVEPLVEIRVGILAESVTTPLREVEAKVRRDGLGSSQGEKSLRDHDGRREQELRVNATGFNEEAFGYLVNRNKDVRRGGQRHEAKRRERKS
jgi:hypothetical protein